MVNSCYFSHTYAAIHFHKQQAAEIKSLINFSEIMEISVTCASKVS